MQYEIKKIENRVSILLQEEFFDAQLAEDLKKLLDQQAGLGSQYIELDLSLVKVITSHWIGMLLLFRKHFHEQGGQLKLIRMHDNVRGIFQLMNINSLLDLE
ncbi:MAG: hypothetical protein CVV50_02695 [Spirochaetae bacterium HGW-Spirochaetae-6]|nr:MAG: hypothetical protein CVV50_02695 [Spirochaetae bacterium HGW-Spirochaetae-6]